MAESKRDYYEVLGIPKGTDEGALKKAYRRLAKKYHPDVNPGDKATEAKFKKASEAYSVLSDLQERQQYDQFDHAAFEQGGVGASDFGGGSGGLNFDGNMSDIFGDIFGDVFGGSRSGRAGGGSSRGANIKTSVKIIFEEAVFSCDREVEINFKETCTSCHGTGAKAGTSPQTCSKCSEKGKTVYTQQPFFETVQNVQTCPDCDDTGQVIKEKCPDCYGAGYKTVHEKFKVSIPTDINNGQCVRLAGNGEPGTGSDKRDGLLVEAVVSQHPIFKRQDTSAYSAVPISFIRAVLGDPTCIKTVGGKVEYDVRPGTQADTKTRLKGKDVPSLRSRGVRGDHYIALVVQVPEHMNQAQKKALRRFDDAMNSVTSQGEGKSKEKGIFE